MCKGLLAMKRMYNSIPMNEEEGLCCGCNMNVGHRRLASASQDRIFSFESSLLLVPPKFTSFRKADRDRFLNL